MQVRARFFIFLLGMLFQPTLLAQDAKLHATTIAPDDMAILYVAYRNQRPAMFQLDTTALEKDFDVIDIKSTIKMDRQAGTFGNTMHWRVMLAPKRSGNLTIPPLRIREAITPELQLTVLPANPWQAAGEDIRLEMVSDKSSPRVGEQFNIRIRFLTNRPIGEGLLSDPKPPQVERLGLGRDQVRREFINGVEYEVMERNIAMFAQSPGPLVIDPVIFRGKTGITEGSPASGDERYFLRRSPPVTLEVKPIAAGYEQTTWYPLANAALRQQWEIPEGPLKPGDQILRRITLQTDGLPVKHFAADMFETETSGALSYLDQPSRRQTVDPTALLADYQQDQLFVINHEGPLNLPALQFNYWDTKSDQPAKLQLEGKLLDVPPLQSINAPLEKQAEGILKPGLLLSILVLSLLLLAWVWWLLTRRLRQFPRYNLKPLKRACLRNDAADAAKQTLAWGRASGLIDSSQGLRALAQVANNRDLTDRLLELDAKLFASQPGQWQGQALWRAIRGCQPTVLKTRSADSQLPPLYPSAV